MRKLGAQLVHREQYCFATRYDLTASPFDLSRAVNNIRILYYSENFIDHSRRSFWGFMRTLIKRSLINTNIPGGVLAVSVDSCWPPTFPGMFDSTLRYTMLQYRKS
jgi:hypothetical protein